MSVREEEEGVGLNVLFGVVPVRLGLVVCSWVPLLSCPGRRAGRSASPPAGCSGRIEELVVLRVLVARGELAVLGGFALVFVAGLGPSRCSAPGAEASEDRLVLPIAVLGGL